MIDIGTRIREARQARGFSQGELEARTGLLRCYLSRVENGHTEPSLQTLARIAAALDIPVAGFFQGDEGPAAKASTAAAESAEEAAFLAQMRAVAGTLGESERRQVLELAKKMAAGGR
jgi:transcriptional regulator with XRE-family HTH domain